MKRSLSCVVVAVVGAACWVGCNNASSTYSFETSPRPLLGNLRVGASWAPQISVDTAGTLYLLTMYEQNRKPRLGFTMSHDQGDTFMPIIPVSAEGAPVSSHGESSPRFITSNTVLYASWLQPTTNGGADLMIARSLSWGENFEKPVQITDKNHHSYAGFLSLAILPHEDVAAVWLDERDEKPNSETFSVYFAKSTDKGATFGHNVRVADHACPCCRPSIAADSKGNISVAWRKVFPGEIRDMVVSNSRDGGATFDEPVAVTEDGWKINGCPDSGPSAAVLHGKLFLAWLTEGREQRARIRLAFSDDQGHSFRDSGNISGNILDPNHPTLRIAQDERLIAVFQGRQPKENGSDWNKIQAFVVEIDGDGRSHPPVALPASAESISYPSAAAGNGGRLFVTWTQPRGESQIAMLSRGRKSE